MSVRLVWPLVLALVVLAMPLEGWAAPEFPNSGSSTQSYSYVTQWGSLGFGGLERIAIDGFGNVYVTDALLDRVQIYGTDGTYRNQWSEPLKTDH